VWVYAICGGVDDEVLAGLRGVDGEAPRRVDSEDLTAVVGSVDLDRFGADGLRRSLNDLDRLAAMARAHHGIVAAAATAQPIAPARLATVYEDDDRVREMLATHREALIGALRQVTGCQEWGVKAYATARPEPAAESASAAPATGAEYLNRRRSALSSREAAQRQVAAGAEALSEQLAPLAVETRRHRPQDPQLSGDSRAMLVNDAYLVKVDDGERLGHAVTEFAEAHPELAVELTGPWPPYSFAVIEEVAP